MASADSQFRNTAKVSSLFLIWLGIAALPVALLDLAWFKSGAGAALYVPGTTAVCWIVLGYGIRSVLRNRTGSTARAAYVAFAALSSVTGVAVIALGQRFAKPELEWPILGTQSQLSGIYVFLTGLALLLLVTRRTAKAGRTVAVALLIACSFLLVSLCYGATALYEHTKLGSISLLETLGFMFVAAGLFAAKPSPALASLLRSRRASGWLTRMLLGTAVLVPFLLGLIAVHVGAFNQQSRAIAAVFVVVQMVLFIVVTCTTMSRLAQSEDEDEATRQALVASERMLQESQKIEAIGVLAGGLAHDFNNLLNVISGYSELLLHDSSLGQMQRSKVEKIAKAGQTAAGLTRQLLAFSRKQVLQPQALDLNKIISSKDSYLHRFIKENIDFSTSLDPALMATLIDPTQLEQILLNLVINACDAMPEGGRLNITTTNVVLEELAAAENGVKPGAFVRLTMSDTGVGMDENTRTRIFEPFFTTKVVGKGTGLGLATVYGIVKQSGGFIKVDSKVGRGTTFLVFLPATRSPLSGDQLVTATPHASGGATILLVEDSELLRELVFETLESMGYTVLMARDGREALRLCTQFSGTIDLVLSDVVMPKMNGPEVVKKVKEIRPEIAAIFMSGYADEAIIRRGQVHSGASFLQKPFSSSDLRDKVREVLVQAQEKRSVRERLNAAMLGRVKSLEVQDLD